MNHPLFQINRDGPMFAIENLTIYDSKAMWTEDPGIESEEKIRLGSWKCTPSITCLIPPIHKDRVDLEKATFYLNMTLNVRVKPYHSSKS